MQNINKNILILSWFFPPSTMPAATRTLSYAKYLNRNGYFPIIISRKWDLEAQNLNSFYKASVYKNIEYISNQHCKIFLLPYNPSFRDKLATNSNRFIKLFRKIFILFEFVLFPFFVRISPYYSLYFFSKKIMTKYKFDAILATGNPFELFRISQKLSKDFNVPYILDYRDDWSTSQFNFTNSFFGKLKRSFTNILEKSWARNCSFFISVTPEYVNRIQKVINKDGFVIYNGFFVPKIDRNIERNSKLNLFLSGTISESHDFSVLFEAVQKYSLKYGDKIAIYFIGSEFTEKQKKLIDIFNISDKIIILPRLSFSEINFYYNLTDVFLLFSYGSYKGRVPLKLFEYLAYQKPILLCPSDGDIMEEILVKTQTGFIANDSENCFNILCKLYESHVLGNNKSIISPNINEIYKYTRKEQIKKLAQILDKYI